MAELIDITGDASAGFTIINSHTPETIDIEGTKTWNDADDQDGIRPESITVNLLADGTQVNSITIKADEYNNWQWSFKELPKNKAGQPIEYTITETAIEGYETTISELGKETDPETGEGTGIYKVTIENDHTPETIDISGSKTWDDADDQDGMRPESITINLIANDEPVIDDEGDKVSITVSATDGWNWNFKDLPKYSNGEEIVYTIIEDAITNSNGQKIYEAEIDGYNVTNTHIPETVDITGTKTWNDNNDQDGIRPSYIFVYLMADGEKISDGHGGYIDEFITPDESGNWSWTFKDFPKYKDGKEIVYTFTEEEVKGYTSTFDGNNIVNTHTPETVTLSGTKIWDDASNQDGKRPESVIINLLADGESALDEYDQPITATVTQNDNWEWSFSDLPKYRSGKEIQYNITENSVEDYSTEISIDKDEDTDNYIATVTNRYIPEKTSLGVIKIWDDADDQDGMRPKSISVSLFADGEDTYKSLTLDASNNWQGSFTELDVYTPVGQKIEYTLKEVSIDGYETRIDKNDTGFVVTNSHMTETINISGTKTWNDADDQDGIRPESITIHLLADDEPAVDKEGNAITAAVTGQSDEGWSWTFTDIPKYRDGGQEIKYSVAESQIEGYEATITGDAENGYTITNTHMPKTIDIEGTKTWDDANDQDGMRPESITINLLADGTQVDSATVEADEYNNWQWIFKELPKNKAGLPIMYTITEGAIEGYETTISDLVEETDPETGEGTGVYKVTIENSHIPETIDISGSKTWDDADDQDGMRPESITINLIANDEPVIDDEGDKVSITVSATDGWSWSFTDLPKYRDGGAPIVYTISEDAVKEYVTTITYDENTGFTVTNTHTPETIDISVTKAWDDVNDQDGVRPSGITITLYADGQQIDTSEVTINDDWSLSFTDLPKYRDGGISIVYTIGETALEGYDTDITYDEDNGYIVTNTHTPETIDISGKKTWVDNDDQDGYRPDSITIRLRADGEVVESRNVTVGDDWSWSFTDLPKYRDGGVEIVYTITEDAVDHYAAEYDGYDVTNTHTPDQTSVTVTKAWDDNGDQDGIRSESITVMLLADGVITDKVLTLDETNNWTGTFAELDMHHDHGEDIVYTVEETQVPDGYEAVINGDAATGYIITNSHEPEMINITGLKVWDDNDNQDGIRPSSIFVYLLADGYRMSDDHGGYISHYVTPDENGVWSWTFTNVPRYRDGRTEIVYAFTEEAVEGYSSESDGYYIINTHIPETVEISVLKIWDDNDDQDGIRPENITINLMADGEQVESAAIQADENDEWSLTFADLPKRKAGKEIKYAVEEITVDGYTTTGGSLEASIGEDGTAEDNKYTVTFNNKHTPETLNISGSKTWDDADDQDGVRPENITINLLADDAPVMDDDGAVTATVSAADGWSWSFEGLPKYRDGGIEIIYTITEDAITDDEGNVIYQTDVNGYDVTNSYTPESIDISGSKTWDDADDQDGVRPDSITINLLADSAPVMDDDGAVTATVSAADGWSWSFEGLPKYRDGGIEIIYTITENEIVDEDGEPIGYLPVIDGYNVTNSYIPKTIDINGSKNWADADDQDGVRPASITIRLLADGTETDSSNVTAEDDWAWSFTSLPKYRDGGVEIAYTITEDAVDHYAAEYDGYDVTNTHTPDQTSVTVTKAWDDNGDQDGIRPESVTVILLADGVTTNKVLTLDETNNWTGTFTELDMYHDHGEMVVYTVEETDKPESYEVSIEGNASTGFIITNSHVPETIDISGRKTWDDSDDQDGVRPDEITIVLYADQNPAIDNDRNAIMATVTAADGWSWTFEGLPKYRDGGIEIIYTITENEIVDDDGEPIGYSPLIDGYDVTNSYTPETLDIIGSKIWDDADDQDGIRPDSITVYLHADNEEIDKKTITGDEDDWNFSFTDLPKYRDHGTEIEYTVTEDDTDGYMAEISSPKLQEDGSYAVEITNTHTPETTYVEGSKTWDDNDDQDGLRPDSITVRLLADGTETDSREVTIENGWSWSFTDLPKYRDAGVEIIYSVTEDAITDDDGNEIYQTEINGYSITNSYLPETIDITGGKTWDDADNQDGIRPGSITVHLFADDEEADEKTITRNEDDEWSFSFTDLPKYRDHGTEIEYTVTEDDTDGYTAKISSPELQNDGSYVVEITNTHIPETTHIEGRKMWVDDDDQDGYRPDSIVIRLLADGTEAERSEVTAEGEWEWSFTDLSKYRDGGVEIVYTITEDAVDHYAAEYNGNNVTNIHTPDQTSVTVTKAWDDNGDQDGIRPESITVTLLADGEETGRTLILNESNDWIDSFSGLDMYHDHGEKIEYTIEEADVSDGYAVSISGDPVTGYSLINTHAPETVEISGTKTWEDKNDQDGIRPDAITIYLSADGEVIISTSVTEADEWTWKFTDLPKYRDGGEEIIYTVTEEEVTGYTTEIDGYNIINTHTPETIDITLVKTWEDEGGYDHIPDSIEIGLIADGDETGRSIILNKADDWKGSFEGLDKYRDKGTLIDYTVREISDEALHYYSPQFTYEHNDDGSLSAVIILNRREFFDIDEEIVPDHDDADTWVKEKSVNEYNAIEFEMSTYLPVIDGVDMENGSYSINFHEVLDSELVLGDVDTDFSVYIDRTEVSSDYYVITINSEAAPARIRTLSSGTIDDGCTFHVDIDLSAMYRDGVITDDNLQGETRLIVFFSADLEGTGLNGSYRSTVWYDIYDGDEWKYTSNEDIVEVYTYEIDIIKYDEEKLTGDDYEGAALEGAVLGLYYDKNCEDPIIRNYRSYTVTSDGDGSAVFYGLEEGTYYVKEIMAPDGYRLSDDFLTVELGSDLSDHRFFGVFANSPDISDEPEPGPGPAPEPDPGPGPVQDTGDLTVSKSVTGSGGSTTTDFTFKVTVEGVTGTYVAEKTDADGNVTNVEITFNENGEAEFTLKHGEHITIKDLPVNAGYTVIEVDASGYTTTIIEGKASDIIIENGVIVAFQNYRGSGRSSGGGGGSGSGGGGGSSGSGTVYEGPAAEDSSYGETETTWDLSPLPETGEGPAMLFGIFAEAFSAMALFVLFCFKRKERRK